MTCEKTDFSSISAPLLVADWRAHSGLGQCLPDLDVICERRKLFKGMSNFPVVSKQLVSILSRQVNNFVNKIHGGIKASMLHKVRHYCNYKLIACPLPWKEFTRDECGAFMAPAAICSMWQIIIKICWRTLGDTFKYDLLICEIGENVIQISPKLGWG